MTHEIGGSEEQFDEKKLQSRKYLKMWKKYITKCQAEIGLLDFDDL